MYVHNRIYLRSISGYCIIYLMNHQEENPIEGEIEKYEAQMNK